MMFRCIGPATGRSKREKSGVCGGILRKITMNPGGGPQLETDYTCERCLKRWKAKELVLVHLRAIRQFIRMTDEVGGIEPEISDRLDQLITAVQVGTISLESAVGEAESLESATQDYKVPKEETKH